MTRDPSKPVHGLVWQDSYLHRPRRTWTDVPACRGMDPNIFHANGSQVSVVAICQGCPVRLECLRYALAYDERFGVQGGVCQSDRENWLKQGMSAQRMIQCSDAKFPLSPDSGRAVSPAA